MMVGEGQGVVVRAFCTRGKSKKNTKHAFASILNSCLSNSIHLCDVLGLSVKCYGR